MVKFSSVKKKKNIRREFLNDFSYNLKRWKKIDVRTTYGNLLYIIDYILL